MKKYVRTSRLLTLLFAVTVIAGVPFAAYAQPTVTPSPAATTQPVSGSGAVSTGASTAVDAARNVQVLPGITAGNISDVSQGVASTIQGVIECTGNLPACIISSVSYLILQFANFLLGLAGTLFNWVIVKTVFGFSTFLGNSPGLLLAWRILRDIGNMFLLFGFIFLGLAIILDLSSHTYSAKKTLPRLIIFAILMNFSLFAAQAVIDTSNVISTVLYTQANTDACPYDAPAGNTPGAAGGAAQNAALQEIEDNCFINAGIAGAVMRTTGVTGIFDVAGGQNTYSNAIVLLMMALFATIAAIVLFAGAIMLIIRAVVLAFLMITAPLGFAALALPPFKQQGEEWWNRLIHQSFFAPIYLLLILVSLKITEGFAVSADTRNSLAGALSQPNSSTMGIILMFMLVIGFMIGSLIAARKFGAMGADYAIKTAGSITGNFTYGSLGFAGRRTIGAGSSYAAKRIGQSTWGRTTKLGNFAYDVAKKGSKSSFDLRTTAPVKAALGAVKLDLGKPSKAAAGGFEGEVKAAEEKRSARIAGFGLSKEEEAAVKRAKEAVEAEERAQSERDERARAEETSQRNASEVVLAPQREALQAQKRKIDEARAKGDEQLARYLEESLRTEQSQYEILERAEQAKIKKLQDAAAAVRGESKKRVDTLKKAAKALEDKPKTEYATAMEKRSKTFIAKVMPVSREANAKAAKKIRDDMKKTKTEKALEKIEESVKKAAGDKVNLDEVKDAIHEEAEEHAPAPPRPKPGGDAAGHTLH